MVPESRPDHDSEEADMKWEYTESPLHQRVLTIRVNEIDLPRSEVPKAVRQWYESRPEKKLSDELFYLSEIAKGLE